MAWQARGDDRGASLAIVQKIASEGGNPLLTWAPPGAVSDQPL